MTHAVALFLFAALSAADDPAQSSSLQPVKKVRSNPHQRVTDTRRNPIPETTIVRGQSPEPSGNLPSPVDATVRLHVHDVSGGGAGVGTGTIIDTHYNEEAKADEALLVTCGHLFRESQGKGKIIVDLFAGGQVRQVEGQLLDFDDKHDVALVTIWPGAKVTPVQVAPKNLVSRPQDRVFTIGCSEGREPTVEDSRVQAINRFAGRPNITVAGVPVNGRSGGGLFSADGQLIGVCNAAIDNENAGLYASLPAVHGMLDKFNLQAIYERAQSPVSTISTATPEPVPPQGVSPQTASPTEFHAPPPAERAPALPRNMPRSVPVLVENGAIENGDDLEVVAIVRSKRNPENQSEIYVVDNVSPELLSRITTAARQSAQARSAGRQAQTADRVARQNRASEQPVVRGQFK